MPNIEIHGYGSMGRPQIDQSTLKDRGDIFAEKVRALFADVLYGDEVVVTLVNDWTTDLNGTWRPFIRVVSTPGDFIPDVLERLKTLERDIEHQMLAEFFPGP